MSANPCCSRRATDGLIDRGHQVFLEVGPHPVLSANIKEILLDAGTSGTAIPTLRRDVDDHANVRAALADLYVAGALDTEHAPGSSEDVAPHRALPSHQFQRQRLWTVDESILDDRTRQRGRAGAARRPVDAGQPEWRAELAVADLPWLRDHVVTDKVLLPGAAYLDAGLAAAAQLTGRPAPALDDVRFVAPLVVDDNDITDPALHGGVLQRTVHRQLAQHSAAGWTRHATGRIVDGLIRPEMELPEVTGCAAIRRPTAVYRLAEQDSSTGRPSSGSSTPGSPTAGCWPVSTPAAPASPPPTTRPTRRCWTPRCSASRC